MPRLFVGLEPDAEARARIWRWAAELAEVCPGRYYEKELYHVTVLFLGGVGAERLPALERRLCGLSGVPFTLALGEAACFKGGRVLYAGVRPCPPLMDLAVRVRSALSDFLPPDAEEGYVPHLTLARHAQGCGGAPLPPEISFPVRHFTLFESTRVDDRLAYLPLRRFPLAGEEGAAHA